MGRRSDYRDYGYTRAVWNGLYNLINNEIGLAALLGNLWAESGIVPYRCENDNNSTNFFNRSRIYTNSVDNGTITREQFINSGLDGDTVHKGYGLAQWTYYTRKTGYYDAWKSGGYTSIGSVELAVYYLSYELQTTYASTLEVLRNATDMRTASTYVLKNFENPTLQGQDVQDYRFACSMDVYDDMHGNLPPEIKVLTIDPISASIVDGESIRITVNANSEWTYNLGQYLAATKEDNALIVSGNANGAQVTSVVNFWLVDDRNVTAQCQIGINRPAPPIPEINVTPYSQRANVGTVVRFNVRSNYDWGVNVPYGAELVKKERGYCYIKVNVTALRRVVIRFFILSDTNIYQNCTINIYGVAPIPSARKTPFIYYLKPFLGKGR